MLVLASLFLQIFEHSGISNDITNTVMEIKTPVIKYNRFV